MAVMVGTVSCGGDGGAVVVVVGPVVGSVVEVVVSYDI